MQFTWQILTVLLLLGVLQLAVGVALGRWLPVRGARQRGPVQHQRQRRDMRRMRYFSDRLGRLMENVAGEVGQHRDQIDQVNRQLESHRGRDDDSILEFVLRGMARIIEINEQLQGRLAENEERLRQQARQVQTHFTEARTDALTGLLNRRALDDSLRRQMHACRRGRGIFTMVMIDVDHFKQVNDRHGHPAGDDLLSALAQQFEELVNGAGTVARYGGEEFAVLLPGVESEKAKEIAERLRRAVASREFFCQGVPLGLTVSLGLATSNDRDEDELDVTGRADEALYAAKKAGRNRVYYHDGSRCRPILPATPSTATTRSGSADQGRSGAQREPGEQRAPGESGEPDERVDRPLEELYTAVREQLERVAQGE